jgi:hypothetical protein
MIGIRSMLLRSGLRGLAAAALVPALAAPAAARWIDTVDGWEVNMTPQTCTMTTTFSDDTTVGLVWAPATAELGFVAATPPTPEMAGRKTAPLALTFDGRSAVTQWEDQAAAVIPGDNSVGLLGHWGAAHTAQLAGAVQAARHVRVRVGARDLGEYEIGKSGAAYQALLRCGRLIADG